MKNICKILASIILLTGIACAEDFTQVHAEHILVKTAAEALQIKKDIDNGGNFEYYARVYSLCPSGQNNGDLGYFGKGQSGICNTGWRSFKPCLHPIRLAFD